MAVANGVAPLSPSTPDRAQLTGVVMYLVAAFLFAANGVLAKSAIEVGLSPLRLTELRNAGSMIFLVILVAIMRPKAFRVKKKEIGFLALYGVIAFTMVQFLYFFTISLLPVGVGTLLAFLAPIVVALYLKYVKKKFVRNRIWLAIILTLIGLALVAQVWLGGLLNPLGVASGLVLAVVLALYWILGESGQTHRDALSLTMWGFIFSTLTWSIIAPWWSFPFDVLLRSAAPMQPGWPGIPVWLIMTFGVIFGTVTPFLLVLGSLRRIGAARSGIIGTTEPIWAGILAMAFLGEAFTTIQGIGGLIVIAGILVAETSRTVHITVGELPLIEEESVDEEHQR